LIAALMALTASANGDTLVFVPQLDSNLGATNYSWSFPLNWFTLDAGGNLVPVGRVPHADEDAIITSLVDAGGSGLRLQNLLLTNSAVVSNGIFAVYSLQMLSASSFQNANVRILVSLNVGGTNCTLNGTFMSVLPTCYATFAPVAPATVSTLTLAQGSVFTNSGMVMLAGGSQIIAGSLPTNTLIIEPGAVLSSTNLTYIEGSAAGHLIVDNSGLVRVDGGTLSFDSGIDWLCSAGTGEFRAGSPTSLVLFASPFHADLGTTSLFTGPGTNRWSSGGTIDGTAQVGALDTNTSVFSGNLEVPSSCSGLGSVHVLGNPGQPAVLNWINGTLSLAAINIDANATMLISGGAGTSRQLSGCGLTNSGLCSVLSGDLTLAQGASINNLAGGTINLMADGTFYGSPLPSGGAVNNAGTFRKSSHDLTQFGTINPPQGPDFNNAGLVDVVSGQLNLMGGTSYGQFHTETTNTVLWFWGGTHTLGTGASFRGPGSVRLYQGASAPQWLVNGGVSATELELGTNGLVVGTASTSDNPVTFGTLLVSANGSVSNGTFAVQDAQMLDESAFIGLTLTVTNNLLVGGMNCVLDRSILDIASSASATLVPVAPAAASMLTLAEGSVLQDSGTVMLAGGSQITLAQGSVLLDLGTLILAGGYQIIAGSLPTNTLIIEPGAVLSSTNLTYIEGSAAGHLIVDNSGLVRVDGGTLSFDSGIDWRCSARTGEFRAGSPTSLVLFASPFHADVGTTNLFTGPGTNRWPSGGTIDGTAQVGALDPDTLVFSGNLEILSSCSGLGRVHVLGNPGQPAVLNWNNGTLSLAAINVDANATMLISGGAGTSRQLSGCALNNQGNILFHDQATVACGNGATLNNLVNGTLDIQTDVALTTNNASPMLVINNAGRFVKSAGMQTSLIAANLNNSGTLEVEAGTLQFQGSWSQTAGSTTVDGGTVLGATLLSIGGGTLAGTGTIQATVVPATVVNGGVTSPGGSPGTLTLGPGENYQQGAGGTLRIELGGHNPGTNYDQLVVGGNASLAGTLELLLIKGFVPQPGDQFQILTCGSQTGAFSQINAPALSGAVWVAHYTGTNVSAVLADQVKIAQPVLSGGLFSLSFNTTAGLAYVVQESGSLNPSYWQTLTNLAGDGGPKTISDPASKTQRFYRISIQ
jgi:hypothetical protein